MTFFFFFFWGGGGGGWGSPLQDFRALGVPHTSKGLIVLLSLSVRIETRRSLSAKQQATVVILHGERCTMSFLDGE